MFDLTKKYKTIDGRPVINLRTREDNDIYPLIGHIEGHGSAAWTAKGHYYIDDKKHPLSLIEAKPALLLDLTKPLQTKAQRPVRILSTEGKEPYPIVGYIGDSPRPTAWTQEGKCHNDAPVANLENVPPVRHVRYLNIYSNDTGYASREEADRLAATVKHAQRIACIRYEFIEGQFDD
jgi:hypothetical protein